jgi:DNA repair exonuclease SbcCD ATPase subunit
MQSRFLRQSALLVSLVLLVSIFVVDAGGQTRRKRRARRVTPRPVITNPVIAPPGTEQNPGTDGERIISTADETPAETGKTAGQSQPKSKSASKKTADEADMKDTINSLSNQVDRLNDKLSQMQENDRSLIDMERLTRAEQRAESLRLQQIDVESKLADLQARLEQVEYGLKPENIERASGFGTVHPEEAREARRRQLETEKKSTQAQIRILETSRARLETAVSTADAEVDALRQRIEAQRAQQSVGGPTSTERRTPANPPRPE